MRKLKGVYLIPDANLLLPGSGSKEHIDTGIRELSRYFDIVPVILSNEHLLLTGFQEFVSTGSTIVKKKNPFLGLLRDIKRLFNNHYKLNYNYKRIKAIQPDFIYERSEYLHLSGLRIAKKLGIKHFYEVNWIHYSSMHQFYNSWFNPLAKKIEEWSYNMTQLGFYVGGLHKHLNVDKAKCITVQNGISEHELKLNEKHDNHLQSDGIIKVCMVAKLMQHHRFDVFIKALSKLKSPEVLEFTFIGAGYDYYLDQLPSNIKYKCVGKVEKSTLPTYLLQFNAGIISGGPSYSSFMKLYEYAAAKLAVICPDLENIKEMFRDNEIVLFDNLNENDLADKLNALCDRPQEITMLGEKFYSKVLNSYTWERIFWEEAQEIMKHVNTPYNR